MPLSDLIDIIKKNISKKQINALPNGLICLKGGELQHVLNQLTYVISEICDCLIINANQAAITLTNHLFENMLKQALITIDSNGRYFDENEPMDKTFEAEVKEYDEKNLCDAIKQCKSKRLITQDEVLRLNYLKNIFRNPFSHENEQYP